MFPGCWECGQEGHRRQECPEWKKVITASGAPPEGHKGARDKAYAKWKANRTSKRMNSFESDDLEDEWDELDDEEYDPLNFSLIAKGTKWDDARSDARPSTTFAHLNAFSELESEDIQPAEPIVEELNRWAHVVIDAKKQSSQRARKVKTLRNVKSQISSPEDLAFIKALPTDFAALARIAKQHPSDSLLKPGEQWVMMDSGANVDAADISTHFPEYARLVTPLSPSVGNGGAECASGNVVKCRGRVRVHGSMDGQATSILFRDMDIKMPIASMKKRVQGEDGFDVFITTDGGIMRHRTSGKLVRLYDRGGVYFAKFKTKLPADGGSPFGRQG